MNLKIMSMSCAGTLRKKKALSSQVVNQELPEASTASKGQPKCKGNQKGKAS